MHRRQFLTASAATSFAQSGPRPNILWLTCEDIGPQLGCYGDRFARTPNLDNFAGRSLRYSYAWSNAPVCAPARTTIISGLYPPSTGAEHMRSMTRLPASFRMFPGLLRDSGYYCTNNVKEDYNIEHTGKVWDDSSNRAHWRNRRAGQPFFAVFNNVITHESQIRRRPHTLKLDPREVRIPAYHPDTPEVRHDWTQYYDNITTMDTWFGQMLAELHKDGLTDDTVVFFYGDHGSGMPRSKRWPYNSGLQVPMIVHTPEKFRHLAPADHKPGGTSDRVVSFVDLAPTVLSLAGIEPASYHQGYAFLGRYQAPPHPYIYGFRGRMDERYDMARSVRDKRYVYIRQYMPHRIYGQHVAYMFETPTTQVWKRLHDEGKLNAAQDRFWQTKPAEELYDLDHDPDEVNNLASSPAHRAILERMRAAQRDLVLRVRDVGFLPEGEIHSRSAGSTPYEMGHDTSKYPLEKILAAADQASTGKAPSLSDADSAVRYWAAQSYLVRRTVDEKLRAALTDLSPYVRALAAEALGLYGTDQDAPKAVATLMELAQVDKNGPFVSILALNALNALAKKAKPAEDAIRKLPTSNPNYHQRFNGDYVTRLIEKTLEGLH